MASSFSNPAGTSEASASAMPMPPLPDLSGAPKGAQGGAPSGLLASLLSGVGPIESDVTAIQTAAKRIAQSGIGGPAAMQTAAQIVQLAQQLLSTVAQQSLQPQAGQGQPGGGNPAMMQTPPSPGGPQSLGAQ